MDSDALRLITTKLSNHAANADKVNLGLSSGGSYSSVMVMHVEDGWVTVNDGGVESLVLIESIVSVIFR